MSNRRNSSTSLKNPSGFSFTVKRKANPSGTSTFVPNIDLSKPLIKYKAKTASSSISSKKGGRNTRKKTHKKSHKKYHKKTYRKKHVRKSHKKVY
jgi:hypothetical protein